MLHVVGLSKAYGPQVLFNDVSFTLGKGERIGLVGRNGHGKSTLFKIIIGEEHADSGQIRTPANYRIGHLSQSIKFSKPTVLEEACLALPKSSDGIDETYKVKAILHGLGFDDNDFIQDPEKLSGGFQVRLNLVKILVSQPNLLLLDEPTNYLDIVSMRWLTRFLQVWEGELMLITHDRSFMDGVVTHVLGIHRQNIRKIPGNTEKYLTQIEQDEEIYEKTRLNQERKVIQAEKFIERFRAKASKATVVQSRIKQLEKMERYDKLDAIEDLEFKFRPADFEGKWLVEIKDLSFGYRKDERLINNLSFAVGKRDRIAIIGRNGKGKTTLLNLVAKELYNQDGSIVHSSNLKLGYFGQTNVERLNLDNTVEEEILSVEENNSRGRARGVCGLMMFEGDAALKKVKVLSGGEKSRVLLGKLLVQRSNLLLLDEPTNHLDMYSCEALIQAAKDFPGAIMIVTHNEEILDELATRLIVFDRNETFLFEGTYRDFLERVGWQEEDDLRKSRVDDRGGVNKKEARKRRADIISRRSKECSPLKARMDKIETEIVAIEAEIKEQSEQLIELSKDGFGDDAAKLSRTLCKSKEKIEALFQELELVTKDHDKKWAEYEQELGQVVGG